MIDEDAVLEAIRYFKWCIGQPKREVSRDRLSNALATSFRFGYGGNHQSFQSKSLTLYRGRTSPDGAIYSSVSELWYPKNRTAFSRADLMENVFYCSYGCVTSLLELRPDAFQTIYVMECVSIKDVLNLKWIAEKGVFGLHEMREPFGSFERLCSEVFCLPMEKRIEW
jgi:hypothetical protein